MTTENGTTAKQTEILDKALILVGESGLSGLTIRKIAERMNFSEPALYRHFPNKQAVILGLMDRLEVMLVDAARHIAEETSLPARERLSRIITHHVQLVRKYNSLPILLLAEASTSDDPVLLDRMRTILHAYMALLVEVVTEGQAIGTIDPSVQPDCLALGLMGTPTALAVRHRLFPDTAFEDRIEEAWIPYFLDRIGPVEGGHQ